MPADFTKLISQARSLTVYLLTRDVKGEARTKVSDSEPGGQERVTDENGDFGGRYRASEAERYSRKSRRGSVFQTQQLCPPRRVALCPFRERES